MADEHTVERVSLDHGVSLVLGNETQIRFEGRPPLISGRGRRSLRRWIGAGYAERLMGLLHDTVTLDVGDDGTLRVVGSDVGIEARPDPAYESWTLSRADGSGLVCMPGGEMAEWGPSADT